jgi:transcriptional regulator with XRE-family HTH domain
MILQYNELFLRSILKVLIHMREKSIPKVSIRQIKAARALLAWSQEQLATAAGVSIPTIKRLEAEDGLLGGREGTATKIRLAFESAGVEFTNGDQPGVRIRKAAGSDARGLSQPPRRTGTKSRGAASAKN